MDKIILYTIGLFFVIGGMDYIFGSPLKLGNKFEEGIKTMGALALGMTGIYSLAPIISKLLSSFILPFSKFLKMDPSIIPSAFIAVDMGGYQIATKIALSKEIGQFSGVIIASSLGATISFTLPVALGLISKDDEKYFLKGVLIGIVSIPFGCFAGGLWQGININILLYSLWPILLLAMIFVIGLVKLPKVLIYTFKVFGKFIISLSIIGLLLQGLYAILGIELISGLVPIKECMYIVGKIAFVLGGAYPMLTVLNRIFKEGFERLGKRLDINSASVSGLIGNLASNLLIFGTYKEMDSKGKIICTAFGVSGAFVFGGQLGFVSGVAPNMLGAFIISKFAGGLVSILLAKWLYEREINQYEYVNTNINY